MLGRGVPSLAPTLTRAKERARDRAKRMAPSVLTRLPGSSIDFGPPRRLVPSARSWAEHWNAHHEHADAAHFVAVHDAVGLEWPPSIGAAQLERGDLDVARPLTTDVHRDGRATFTLSMPSGRVAGYFGTVITPDDGLLTEASFGFVDDDRHHPIRRRRSAGRLEHLDGTAATIAFGYADAFYHWMFDVLPRLEILRLAGWDRYDHLVVNGSGAAYEAATLDRCGVPAERVRQLDVDTQVMAQRLVAPSTAGVCGEVPRWAAQFLRDRLMTSEPEPGPPLRLYVSRNDAAQRRVADEDRLVARLEPLGFTPLTLTGRSLDEQIDLFRRAEIVVGPHGGGFTNLAWCDPGTAVVELFADDYVNPVFRGLASALDLRHHHVIGRPEQPGLPRSYGAMVVDGDAVVRAVEHALSGPAAR